MYLYQEYFFQRILFVAKFFFNQRQLMTAHFEKKKNYFSKNFINVLLPNLKCALWYTLFGSKQDEYLKCWKTILQIKSD